LSELLAVLFVVERELVSAARDAQRAGADARTCGLERHQGTQRAWPGSVRVGFAPKPVVERVVAVVEDDLRGVARANSELLLLAAHLQAVRALRNEEGCDARRALGGIGIRVDDVVIGDSAIGAELLGAVEHVAVAHTLRAGLHRKSVRP